MGWTEANRQTWGRHHIVAFSFRHVFYLVGRKHVHWLDFDFGTSFYVNFRFRLSLWLGQMLIILDYYLCGSSICWCMCCLLKFICSNSLPTLAMFFVSLRVHSAQISPVSPKRPKPGGVTVGSSRLALQWKREHYSFWEIQFFHN